MRQHINLYRAEFRNTKSTFGATSIAAGCAAVVVAMLVAYIFAIGQLSGIDKELQIVDHQESAALKQLEQMQPLIGAVSGEQTWAQRLDDATRALEEKQLVLSLVQGSTLGDTLGFSRYLRSLARQDTDGLWLTRISLSALGNRNRLQGKALRAELVATYLQRLADEPPFARQRFNQFQIEGPADGDAAVTFSMHSDDQLVANMVDRQ
ncbi:MAG: PilN domain-containing protein [Gammaproteobacteria bacterium]|nr:PilN domain-containing protein [Gammaproteobacteria bacterium]